MKKRGQTSVELVVITAIALVVLLVILNYNQDVYTKVSGQFEAAKARSTVDKLADAAQLVYQQGSGARTKVFLTMPSDINNINISGSIISMSFAAGGSENDVYRSLPFTVQGSLPTDAGNYEVFIEASEGYVSITQNAAQLIQAACGNNGREAGEDCDGPDFGSATCITEGYSGGALACNSTCTFDYSSCTSPDITPPATITSLTSPSQGINFIYWAWLNPEDTDFDHVELYINGAFEANTSDSFYNKSGLTENTPYEIGILTADTSDNINTTWVNDTSSAAAPETWEIYFLDDFNRADDENIGQNWTETGNRWRVSGSRALADDCNPPGSQITSISIDLAGKTESYLTFDWQAVKLDSGECLNMDLNDGSGWVTDVFTQCSSGNNQDGSGSANITLADSIYLTATVQLRFGCQSSNAAEEAYIDNVKLAALG